MTERWLPVPAYEDIYEVSDRGRMRRIADGKMRKFTPNTVNGYLYVSLSRNNLSSTRSVHSVVAEAFHGPRPTGMEVDHIDHDRHNNTASNLRWLTSSENKFRPFGELQGGHKLTEAAVHEIRASAESLATLGRKFGVDKKAIDHVRHRRTWAHI